jgi:hypothetical protein
MMFSMSLEKPKFGELGPFQAKLWLAQLINALRRQDAAEEFMWEKEAQAEEPQEPNLDDVEDISNYMDLYG